MGEPGPVPPEWADRSSGGIPSGNGSLTDVWVSVAIARACRALPFEPTCLAQAAAGQVMLRRRGEPGTVVIGLWRAPVHPSFSESSIPAWAAHAWLVGATGTLTGGTAESEFTAATAFRPRLPRRTVASESEGGGHGTSEK